MHRSVIMLHIRGTDLAQSKGIAGYLIDQVLLLRGRCEVDASLKHTASMPVCGDLHCIDSRSIIYELILLRPEALQAALDHVIAIKVTNEGYHARPQGLDH